MPTDSVTECIVNFYNERCKSGSLAFTSEELRRYVAKKTSTIYSPQSVGRLLRRLNDQGRVAYEVEMHNNVGYFVFLPPVEPSAFGLFVDPELIRSIRRGTKAVQKLIRRGERQ